MYSFHIESLAVHNDWIYITYSMGDNLCVEIQINEEP
jgi:hypothetical protein